MAIGVYAIPGAIIILFNIITFVSSCVVVIKLKVQQEKMKASGRQSDQKLSMSSKKACKLLLSLTGIMCLLGLPWIAVSGANVFLRGTVFQLIFTIYYSLQGLFLFMFFAVTNPKLRNQWIKILCKCWMRKKRTSLPIKHNAQPTPVNLCEQHSPNANMRETE